MAIQTISNSTAGVPELGKETVSLDERKAEQGAPTMEPREFYADVRVDDEVMPIMAPPSEVEIQAIKSGGIAAWHNSKKITAMWCNSSDRNAYAAITGMGWKKIANSSDSAFLTLTMLASHAEQTNSTCNIRIDSDGAIHEIYVW